MTPLLFELSAAPGMATALAQRLGAEIGELSLRPFPDGESHLRLMTPVAGRPVILLCSLDWPNPKLAPLLFAAAAAREQGALSVGLVAPYLAYMRQDIAFQPGEAVTAASFARILSAQFDWLVTAEPHLHRISDLAAIYSIPAIAVSAGGALAEWIGREVERPVIIGPDEESAPWVTRIAHRANARSAVLRKVRTGDYAVSIDPSGLDALAGGTPVIVDDIASSARTMIEAVRLVRAQGLGDPVCAVVHPIFAGDSYAALTEAGASRIVSTNTIGHPSNAVDLSAPLADAIRRAGFTG